MPSLMDRLRTLADALPPSHIVVTHELARIVSALVQYAEHGEEILTHAEENAHDATMNVSKVEAMLDPDGEPRTVSSSPLPVATGNSTPASAADIAALSQAVADLTRTQQAQSAPLTPDERAELDALRTQQTIAVGGADAASPVTVEPVTDTPAVPDTTIDPVVDTTAEPVTDTPHDSGV